MKDHRKIILKSECNLCLCLYVQRNYCKYKHYFVIHLVKTNPWKAYNIKTSGNIIYRASAVPMKKRQSYSSNTGCHKVNVRILLPSMCKITLTDNINEFTRVVHSFKTF